MLVLLGLFTSSLATFLAFSRSRASWAPEPRQYVLEGRRREVRPSPRHRPGHRRRWLGAAGLFLPPLMGIVIADSGWRAAYLTMALLGALPFVLVFFARSARRHPSRRWTAPRCRGSRSPTALRNRAFWSLCVVFFLLGWALLTMVPPSFRC